MQEKGISNRSNIAVIFILIFIISALTVCAVLLGDGVYLSLNDNLDSNIAEYKMARDIGAFGNGAKVLPFLGGNSQLKIGITLYTLPYYVFSPLFAYYFSFILKVLLSGLGFYFLAGRMNKHSQLGLNQSVFCLCGVVYGLLGTWPIASIEFALLPWWILVFYLLYKTKKFIYIFLPLLFVWGISFPLMGVFALFYTVVIFFLLCIKDRKFHIRFFLGIAALGAGYFLFNKAQISAGMGGSEETIKSLWTVKYTDTVKQSLSMFFDKFFFVRQYHSGGADLKLFVIPVCSLFLLIHIFRLFRKNKTQSVTISVIYLFLYLVIILNTLACCFDDNRLFRSIIGFASGFSFSRFAWLSPCIWLILFALACGEISSGVLKYGNILVAFLMIVFCPGYVSLNSMYNELYYNVSAKLGDYSFMDGNMKWTWKDYYSEQLFEKIKADIAYSGEWAAAYGLDTAVLQYNGISTIDGYYSNYSRKYHDDFERMIQPELAIDSHHRQYWERSHGVRAYLYSPKWDFLMARNSELQEDLLYLDVDVFYKELGGRYIFSRVKITNAEDLGFVLEGKWDGEDSPYTIYVYRIDESSIAQNKARKEYDPWSDAFPFAKNYDVLNLYHNEAVSVESNQFVLNTGGIVFGPGEPAEVGTYTVSFYGYNLDKCTCDAFADSNWYAVQYGEEYRSTDVIRLTVSIIEPVRDIEYRVFNNSDNQVRLQRISVSRVSNAESHADDFGMNIKKTVRTDSEAIDRFRMVNGQGDVIDGIEEIRILVLKRIPSVKDLSVPDGQVQLDFSKNSIMQKDQVFLYEGAMDSIPERYRAKSVDEATLVVLVENEYLFSGYQSESMINWCEPDGPLIEKLYPRFDSVTYFNIYNTQTGLYETKGYKMSDSSGFISDYGMYLAPIDDEWANDMIAQLLSIINE